METQNTNELSGLVLNCASATLPVFIEHDCVESLLSRMEPSFVELNEQSLRDSFDQNGISIAFCEHDFAHLAVDRSRASKTQVFEFVSWAAIVGAMGLTRLAGSQPPAMYVAQRALASELAGVVTEAYRACERVIWDGTPVLLHKDESNG